MSCLIALCIAPEWEVEPSYPLGVFLAHEGINSVFLSEFRSRLSSNELGIKSQNLPTDFAFISAQGFQIDPDIESQIPFSFVAVDSKVRIRVVREGISRRVGIRLHENAVDCSARSVGFVHCNVADTMAAFRTRMTQELTHLPEVWLRNGVFLDCYLWPVTAEQEQKLYIFEAIISNEVNVLISSPGQHGTAVPDSSEWKPSSSPMDPVQHSNRNNRSHQNFITHLRHHRSITEQVGSETSQPVVEVCPEAVDAGLLSSDPAPSHLLCNIVISYVRVEAFQFASELKAELAKFGFSVFLDADGIPFGSDWQDVLNGAINSCSLFVALVTPRYGETMWTNREVKLADILGKKIVPVNFTSSWPPLCLAIQFSTTQFIPWKRASGEPDCEAMRWVASEIHSKYGQEVSHLSSGGEIGSDLLGSEEVDGKALDVVKPSIVKKPSLRSCPTSLPKQASPELVKMLRQPREGHHLVVLISAEDQRKLKIDTTECLESLHCNVYVPSLTLSDSQANVSEFAEKVDEAGVVIVLISESLLTSESCKQQVFYCEQRKAILPVIVGEVKLPLWLSSMMGTMDYVQAFSLKYKDVLRVFIERALNPIEPEQTFLDEPIMSLKQQLAQQLPTEGKLIFVSGGTKFYSPSGEAICREVGVHLAQHRDVVLVTGGFFGVGDTVARSFYDERQRLNLAANVYHIQAVRDTKDKSAQTRQNKDGTFMKVPYGETIFVGNCGRERVPIVSGIVRTCVLVEGGPGAAYEAEQFAWNGGVVVPLRVTGGAAGGGFGIPKTILNCPSGVQQPDWALLGDDKATPSQIAAATVTIVLSVTTNGVGSMQSPLIVPPKPAVPPISVTPAEEVSVLAENDRKRPWSVARDQTQILSPS